MITVHGYCKRKRNEFEWKWKTHRYKMISTVICSQNISTVSVCEKLF